MPLSDVLTSPVTAAAALLVAAACLAVVAVLSGRLRRVETVCAALVRTGAAPLLERPADGRDLRREVEALRADLAQVRGDLGTALRHVAVVRYDAFGDLAGRLSFSAALLDDAGDGVVLTSISGRSETRTWAKGITGGTSGHPLSPEEQEAVARARSPQRAPLERAG